MKHISKRQIRKRDGEKMNTPQLVTEKQKSTSKYLPREEDKKHEDMQAQKSSVRHD